MRVAALIFAAGLMLAAPALAQTDPTPPPSASTDTSITGTGSGGEATENTEQQAETNAEQEQICRTVQRTESRLRARRERICGTRAEWERMEQEAAELTRGNGVQGRRGD